MVNNSSNRLLTPVACKLKSSARGGVTITNGPVYDLSIAQDLLYNNGLLVVNDSAEDDQKTKFNPELDDAELFDFVLGLTDDDFQMSERCKTSSGMILDCDGYAMLWNRSRRCRWSYGAKIYVKFGFSVVNESKMLVLCIHPSKW
jgi:hypothetical protein